MSASCGSLSLIPDLCFAWPFLHMNSIATSIAYFPLGEALKKRGLITSSDLEKALAIQTQRGGLVGSILVRLGAISEEKLLPVLAEQLGMSLLCWEDIHLHIATLNRTMQTSGLSFEWFLDQQVVAWEAPDGIIHCAARNPNDSYLQEALSLAFQSHSFSWHLIRSQDLERLLKAIQDDALTDRKNDSDYLRELAEEAPVIELVNNIITQAIEQGASDIHLEPEDSQFFVRYRIDAVLQTRMTLPRQRFDAVASRIKLVSGMDIAERRLPQDGRITTRGGGTEMDIRVSSVPGVHGESIVMRLLPKERKDLRLERLGMATDHLQRFTHWVQEPHGIILVTGPTGSGKSTTLYAALAATNDRRRKIITVEDPVEYQMEGITQIQAHSEIGYDFARALRAILRQDPDVVMIGEIRDSETARIAVQASLTGHMVLSTLHTNDSLSAFPRLIDMGIEPFLVASSVKAVLAQRLVRRVCDHCSRPTHIPEALKPTFHDLLNRFPGLLPPLPRFKEAVGCTHCHGMGYRGRVGIYELAEMTPPLRDGVSHRLSASELTKLAKSEGFRSLREDGLIKAWEGVTTVEEVLRVTGTGELED